VDSTQNTAQPITSRIVEVFLKGNLSAMLVILSLIAGAVALLVTPRTVATPPKGVRSSLVLGLAQRVQYPGDGSTWARVTAD